jgi:hypothetical protein
MLSSEEQIDSFQHKFLEKQLHGADPDKVAAVKKAVKDAANRQRGKAKNGLLLAADKVQSAIQEAEQAIAQIERRRSTDASNKEKDVASTVKAFGNIVAEAAVGGHDLQEMLDEQGARVDAREAAAPLRELAKSAATGDESETKDGGAPRSGVKNERAPEAAAHAQERAAQNREAQQRELAQRTGDVLYPSVGPEEPKKAQPGDSSWNSKPAEL